MSKVPQRALNGITNQMPDRVWGQANVLDPFVYNTYLNDFNTYTSSDWTFTDTGTPTTALTAYNFGAILTTTTALANDARFAQLGAASFQITPGSSTVRGKKLLFKMKIVTDDAVNTNIYGGFVQTSGTPLTANEGLFFYKATGAATWVLRSITGGTATDLTIPTSLVLVNNQALELGFYVDYKGIVYAWVGDTTGYEELEVNGYNVDGFVASFSPTLSSTLMNLSWGIQTTAAAAKTLTLDFISGSAER